MGSVGTDEWLSVSFRHSRASDCMSKTLQQDSLRCVMGSMSKVSEMECRDPGKEPIEADAGLIKCCKEGQFSCHLARCQRTSLPWVFFSPGTPWHQSHLATCCSTCREVSCERCSTASVPATSCQSCALASSYETWGQTMLSGRQDFTLGNLGLLGGKPVSSP